MSRVVRAWLTSIVLLASLLAGRRASAECTGVCSSFPAGYVRGQYDAVAWTAPTAARPRGTIALGYAHRSGARVTEWDVSRGVALRSASVGGPPNAEADVAMARLDGGLAVVIAVDGGAGVSLTLLDGALKRRASRKLGEGRAPAVSTNGLDLFVAWLSKDDRLILVRLDAKDGRERARTEVAVPSPPPFPAVTLIAKSDRVFSSVRSGAAAVQLASAPLSLEALRTLLVDATSGGLIADADDVGLLTREGDGEIVLRGVGDDLVLARRRTVDHDDAPIGITGAFGPGHVLALPSVLVPPSGDASRRSPSGRLVQRLLWVGAHVVALETSAERPSLVVTLTN
jgi:hypothetical protein